MAGLSLLVIILLFETQPALLLHDNRILNCYEEVCHQHSDYCSRKYRTCEKCQDFTHGLYCHLCNDGYYGNATKSKHGCKRCPCPLQRSNGSCTHDEIANTFKCKHCNAGYKGDHCDECTTGYYKDLKTDLCRPCFCSGHGNSSLQQQCDPVGGRCYACLDMRAGKHCEYCLEGRYLQKFNGTKRCTRCNCNGNEERGFYPICDMHSGICLRCARNTTGVNCEKCANGYEGDAVMAKNCTMVQHPPLGADGNPSKYLIVALMTALLVIIISLLAVSIFIWLKRRKARDPLGFVTINMNNADEDEYNISWIDPVTGDPIRLNGVDVEMPLANGTLAENDQDGYDDEDDLGDTHEPESRDTDRML